MPLGYGRCALDVAGVSDPGMVRVAFEQERLTRTSETQAADQNGKEAPCRSGHRLPYKKSSRLATLPVAEVTVDRPFGPGGGQLKPPRPIRLDWQLYRLLTESVERG